MSNAQQSSSSKEDSSRQSLKLFGSRNNIKSQSQIRSVRASPSADSTTGLALSRKQTNLPRTSTQTSVSTQRVSLLQKFSSYRLEDIPDDVLCEVASWCNPSTILRASLTCKRLATLFQPYLYHSVDLAYTDLCRPGLKVFSRRPAITFHIRTLVLKPNRESGWANSSDRGTDENWMVDVLEGIASQGALPLLSTFRWYGKELPRDSLWKVLRTQCPYLRNIGTSVGQKTLQGIESSSQLLQFRELKGFHLFTQVVERWISINYLMNQELPEKMWQMLFNSVELEELTLDGTCFSDANAWKLEPVFSGRWPRLRSLNLGNVFCDNNIENDDLVCTFLQAHPKLEQVSSLGNNAYSAAAMACLLSLPKLESYQGRLQQLKGAGSLSQVRNVTLTDWFSPSANFGDILCNLHNLESLAVCINFVNDLHSSSQLDFYGRLLGRCPQLKDLAISSTSTLSLRELSQGLNLVPELRMLTVTRVRKLNGSNLTKRALLIARQNLNLLQFTLRDVLPWDHLDQLTGIFRTKQIGVYTVEESDGQRMLSVQENGIGTLRQRYSRSFQRVIVAESGRIV